MAKDECVLVLPVSWRYLFVWTVPQKQHHPHLVLLPANIRPFTQSCFSQASTLSPPAAPARAINQWPWGMDRIQEAKLLTGSPGRQELERKLWSAGGCGGSGVQLNVDRRHSAGLGKCSTPSKPPQMATHTSPEDRGAQGYHLPYRLGPTPDKGNHFRPTSLPRMNRSLQTFLMPTPVLTLR